MLTKVTKILQNVRRTLVYSNELLFLDGQVGLNPAVKSAAQALDIMLEPIMKIGNAEAIEMAVEEGIGIAFVSELAAAMTVMP